MGTSLACGVPFARRHGAGAVRSAFAVLHLCDTQVAAGHHQLHPDERYVAEAITRSAGTRQSKRSWGGARSCRAEVTDVADGPVPHPAETSYLERRESGM